MKQTFNVLFLVRKAIVLKKQRMPYYDANKHQ